LFTEALLYITFTLQALFGANNIIFSGNLQTDEFPVLKNG